MGYSAVAVARATSTASDGGTGWIFTPEDDEEEVINIGIPIVYASVSNFAPLGGGFVQTSANVENGTISGTLAISTPPQEGSAHAEAVGEFDDVVTFYNPTATSQTVTTINVTVNISFDGSDNPFDTHGFWTDGIVETSWQRLGGGSGIYNFYAYQNQG